MSAIVACWVIFSFSGSRDAFRQREIIKPRVVTIATPLNQKVRIRSEGLAAGMGALYCHYCVCQWSFTVSNRIPTVVASERPFRSRSSYLKSIIVIHGMPARPADASEGGLQPHNIWWSGISYRLSMHGTVLPLISLCYTTALSECWAVSRSYWQSNKIIQIDRRTRIMASDWLRWNREAFIIIISFTCSTYHWGVRSRTGTRHYPGGVSSAANDGTNGTRATTIPRGRASVVCRAWNCTIVESYWG